LESTTFVFKVESAGWLTAVFLALTGASFFTGAATGLIAAAVVSIGAWFSWVLS